MSNNILKITFGAKILDETNIEDKTYWPYMSIPELYGGPNQLGPPYILIPYFELRNELFDEMTNREIKNIFLSQNKLDTFTDNLVKKKYITTVPTEIDAIKNKILDKNVDFILDLFFKEGSSFYYNIRYVVTKYTLRNIRNKPPIGGSVTPITEVDLQLDLQKYIIDSNRLNIKFGASTLEGKLVDNMNYVPSMSNPQSYSLFPYIRYIPTIKLSKNMFDKELGDDDIKKIFLSSAQLDKFVSQIRDKKKIVPITIDVAIKQGIIYNNIKFLLELFFKKGTNFYVNNTQYVINNYIWDNKLINAPTKYDLRSDIKIELILHKGSELSFIDSTRLNCKQKREGIVNDYYSLVGLERPANKTTNIGEDINESQTVKTKYPGSPYPTNHLKSTLKNKKVRFAQNTKMGGLNKTTKHKNKQLRKPK